MLAAPNRRAGAKDGWALRESENTRSLQTLRVFGYSCPRGAAGGVQKNERRTFFSSADVILPLGAEPLLRALQHNSSNRTRRQPLHRASLARNCNGTLRRTLRRSGRVQRQFPRGCAPSSTSSRRSAAYMRCAPRQRVIERRCAPRRRRAGRASSWELALQSFGSTQRVVGAGVSRRARNVKVLGGRITQLCGDTGEFHRLRSETRRWLFLSTWVFWMCGPQTAPVTPLQ